MSKLKLVSSQSALSDQSQIAKQLLIADASVKDVDVLLASLKSDIDCWVIQRKSDVKELLKKAFCSRGLSSLHLLGHGMPGAISLGDVKIDITNWLALTCGDTEITRTQSKKISLCQKKSLPTHKWNICFWSCNTGEGSKGKAFMQHVADCTGAYVYASSGLVGHSKCGGNWQLNVVAYQSNRVSAVKNKY